MELETETNFFETKTISQFRRVLTISESVAILGQILAENGQKLGQSDFHNTVYSVYSARGL